MLPSFATDTITVVEPTMVDQRGTLRPTYDPPASTRTVTGCSVQPGAATEDLAGRTQQTVRFTVYAPPGTHASALAAVDWEGQRYAVDGQPLAHRSPTGATSHVVLLLVDWKG